MNLYFQDLGPCENQGVPCVLQRAVIDRASERAFWIAWRVCQDAALKDALSLRKENGVWHVYRTLPAGGPADMPVPPVPYFLKDSSRLLPYQPRAVAALTRSLLNNGCAVDGGETGIGKTYCALAVCRETGLRPGIVCKKSGISAWRRACEYMTITPFFICNWEYARTGKFPAFPRTRHPYTGRYLFNPQLAPGALLIFDECHSGCNDTINAALWLSCRGLHGLYLSATLADRPARLENLIHLLGLMTRDQFREWLKGRGHFTNQHNELESLSSVQDMQAIHKMLYPRYGSRLSYEDDDVKRFFPEANYMTELINLDAAAVRRENELYADLLRRVAQYQDKGRQADKLVAELRFRQAAELLKAPVLADMTLDLVREGRWVCVFVNYLETLLVLAKMLRTRCVVYGEQDADGVLRERAVADFQSGRSRVIICSAQAGGQSLDLHDLEGGRQRVSLICPTYDPIVLQQVLGRTRRAGSRTVPVMKLVYAAGTVEEKVAMTVNAKLDNLSALNRGDLMEPDLFNLYGGVDGGQSA